MALTQDERIGISKKLIEIPVQNALADTVKDQLEVAKVIAQKEDDGNKKLMDEQTVLVNAYQAELEQYDSNGTSDLVEQDIIDAVDKKLDNLFFPNNSLVAPLPSIPDGIWKNFPAFAGAGAVGKNSVEAYTALTGEQALIADLNAKIAIVEGVADPNRSTGLECIDEISPTPDSYSADPTMITASAAQNVKDAVQAWEDKMNVITPLVPTVGQDPDVARQVENDASRADITAAIVVIDTWQAIADFDPVHGTTTCAAFDSLDVSTLNPSKFRAAELDVLKAEITARSAFITARIAQIGSSGHLGSIGQDLSTGEITSATGFYGTRFRFIDMRINLIGGSLGKLKSLENGQNAQDQIKNSNDNADIAYSAVITVTAFRAPAAGTKTIHVIDATGFSVSDAVFIIANEQSEISTTISTIDGNAVVLADNIPKKYRENEGARMYKTL